MAIFGNYLYTVTLLLIGLNRFLSLLQISIPYWSWYADDFLSVIFILGIAAWVLRILKKESKLPLSYLLSFLLTYSFYFEYYLPTFKAHGTADIMDIVAYTCGVFCYHYGINRHLKPMMPAS